MVECIRSSVSRSKIERPCDLSEHVGNIDFPRDVLSFGEIRILVSYHRNKRRIMPGELYVRQFNKYEGDAYTWIAHKGIFDLLCRHKLFPESD